LAIAASCVAWAGVALEGGYLVGLLMRMRELSLGRVAPIPPPHLPPPPTALQKQALDQGALLISSGLSSRLRATIPTPEERAKFGVFSGISANSQGNELYFTRLALYRSIAAAALPAPALVASPETAAATTGSDQSILQGGGAAPPLSDAPNGTGEITEVPMVLEHGGILSKIVVRVGEPLSAGYVGGGLEASAPLAFREMPQTAASALPSSTF